jgi:site-specific DNA recombinase
MSARSQENWNVGGHSPGQQDDSCARDGVPRSSEPTTCRYGGQRLGTNRPVRADRLDQAVWQDVCSLLREPQRIAREHERRFTKDSRDSDLKQLQALTQKVKRGMGRLIDVYQEGLTDRTEFEPRLHQTQARLQSLHEQIATLAAE